MRKQRTLPVLSAHGVVQKGTEIEMVPRARPTRASGLDPKLFRARITDTNGLRDSVMWSFDNQTYSLSELTRLLRDKYGARFLQARTFSTWRIVGHGQSMWDEAERFPR